MTWSTEAFLAVAALLVTLILYVITRSSERNIRRADLVRAYTQDFYQHDDLRSIFASIDDRQFQGVVAFSGSEEEKALIHLLDYINTVGHGYMRRALRIQDLAGTTIGYITFRVWCDAQVQSYLAAIRKSDAEAGYVGAGFQHFYSLAAALDSWSQRRDGQPWPYASLLNQGWAHLLDRARGYRAAPPQPPGQER